MSWFVELLLLLLFGLIFMGPIILYGEIKSREVREEREKSEKYL